MWRGKIQSVDWKSISGWIRDEDHPDSPATVLISIDGALAGRVLANQVRPKFARDGSEGRHGFSLSLTGLATDCRHLIEVWCEETGEMLGKSPWMLEPVSRLDEAVQGYLGQIVHAAGPEDREANAAFVAGLARRLLGKRANEMREKRLQQLALEPSTTPLPQRALLVHGALPPNMPREALLGVHVAYLKKQGCEVAIVTMDLAPVEAAILERLGATAYSLPFQASVEEVLQADAFDVICFAHPEIGRLYGPLAARANPKTKIIVARIGMPKSAKPEAETKQP